MAAPKADASLMKRQAMRILYVGNLRSVHVQRWLRYFASRGDEVHLLTPPTDGASAPGVQVHVWGTVRTRVRLLDYGANAVILLPRVLRFRTLMRQLRPDLVHVHYLNDAALVPAMAGARPLVVTAWGSDVLVNPKGSSVLRWMLTRILAKADLVTCDAAHVKRALVALGADASKVVVIYFGTDTALFHPAKRDPALRAQLGLDGSPTVVSIRSLEPLYDVGTLIAAFPAVLARCPSARLVIAGTGSEEARLQEAARSLGIAHAVRFVGLIPEHDMPRYLASCDVYVSTALSDGGIAASTAEAMACGLPVVITDVGDNREWVHDGVHGFVVPAKDPAALASRLSALVEGGEDRVRLGRNGRVLIEERNNWAREMSRMGEHYRDLIARTLGRRG